jgi:hypothetical protein
MLERILESCRRELVVSGRPITFSAGVAAFVPGRLDDARELAEGAVKNAKEQRAKVKVVAES